MGDLYRLPEVVAVRDQGGARLVCLVAGGQARQSPLGSSQSQEASSSACSSPVVFEELEYHEPVCQQHSTLHNFRWVGGRGGRFIEFDRDFDFRVKRSQN